MKSNNTKNNTRNNDNIENNLYIKSRRKFIITAILSTIIPPALFFLIPLIIERLDFQWVYDISPYFYTNIYMIYRDIFYGGSYVVLFIAFLWCVPIICISIVLYRMFKKTFSYISELENASKQLLDKNVDFIQLRPELSDIADKKISTL